MELGEKLVLLRALEGNLRGLNRALTKSELVRLIREEQGEAISQAYLSQLESGKRPHMTEKTRELLARFFKVHPGYLVSDPEGFGTQLTALPPRREVRVDEWLEDGMEEFRATDPELAHALSVLARHGHTRELLILLARLAASPVLTDELRRALQQGAAPPADPGARGGVKSATRTRKGGAKP